MDSLNMDAQSFQRNQQQQEQKEQQETMRKTMISQVLSQEAAARLNTIRVAKPEKAQQIESYIIQLANSGRMMGKMAEQDLINIVEQINMQTSAKKTKVKFDRRRAALDSDSD